MWFVGPEMMKYHVSDVLCYEQMHIYHVILPKREQTHNKIESNNFLILWFTSNTSKISLQIVLICSNQPMSAVHYRSGT